MNLEEIKQWRNSETLRALFRIYCSSAGMNTTTLGEIIDFLIQEVEKKK
jgi:hypothetical protein